jgi:arabinose-5-phosphate isomerase
MSEDVEDWSEFGRSVLEVEAAAIRSAGSRLGAAFNQAVELLDGCRGKVVTSGVGKSGLAARKLAATLTSTGCPAYYLHPTEALHGDLGIVSSDDVVVCMSHSGESEELLAILPAILVRGVPLIVISGNSGSALVERATVALDAAIEREACPLNLAPTTSVVVAVALGDALAMTLQKRRRFNAQDYALNHPGGRLGRRLTLRVRDVMPVSMLTVPRVDPDARFQDVVCELTAGHMGAICVMGSDHLLLGLIAESDLRRALQGGPSAFDLVARDMMNPRPLVTLTPTMLAYEALELLTARPRPLSVAPVIDDEGRCCGMLRVNDLVRAGL